MQHKTLICKTIHNTAVMHKALMAEKNGPTVVLTIPKNVSKGQLVQM